MRVSSPCSFSLCNSSGLMCRTDKVLLRHPLTLAFLVLSSRYLVWLEYRVTPFRSISLSWAVTLQWAPVPTSLTLPLSTLGDFPTKTDQLKFHHVYLIDHCTKFKLTKAIPVIKSQTNGWNKVTAVRLWLNVERFQGKTFINIFCEQLCQMFDLILPFEKSEIPFRLFGVE